MSEALAMNGAERAAILLMSLGEQDAAMVLKHMGPREVQKIGSAMASLSQVTRATVHDVLTLFNESAGDQTALGIGNDDYLRSVLVQALGEDKASGIIDRILAGQNTSGLDQLKWLDARAITEIIRLEHPQIIAIVLSHLDADQSAEVLMHLPENVRSDIVLRIATLETVQPNALRELDEVLERQFSGNTSVKSSTVGGLKSAANILNYLESSAETSILEKVSESDPSVAEEIEELMFVFDNLVEIDDRGIQTLLREVSTETLVVALKGAEEALREKIFKNMSKRAAEMLRDDLEAKGPVRLSDVEAAQKEILAVARRMADAGEISLGGKGGDEYV
ncbi:MAG: flagellar motor switch protein FliG [Gammaproteobacteria bacterium]|jgi:flagellar motor switch protein FliG